MDGMDETGRDEASAAYGSLDLDALAVSDRFRLFNLTRRDDHLAYLRVLRALGRLRSVYQVQARCARPPGPRSRRSSRCSFGRVQNPRYGTTTAYIPHVHCPRSPLDTPRRGPRDAERAGRHRPV